MRRKPIHVGVVGMGLMGERRLAAINRLARDWPIKFVGYFDPFANPASVPEMQRMTSLNDLLNYEPNWLVVSLPHDVAVEVTRWALSKRLYVLMEKPMGRSLAEARQLQSAQIRSDQLWVGLNYRYYRGVAELIRDVSSQAFGSLISIRIEIGYGGSRADADSWKLDPKRSGSGALLDPGVHALDLARILAGGDVAVRKAASWRGFWGTGVDEEAEVWMSSSRAPLVSVSCSIVRWRSTFRVEVRGIDGYGIVTGRGGNYGRQTYRRGRRWAWESGKRQRETEEVVVLSDEQDVFDTELRGVWGLADGPISPCGALEASETMRLVDEAVSCAEIY